MSADLRDLSAACAAYSRLAREIPMLMSATGYCAINVAGHHFELTRSNEVRVSRAPVIADAPNPQQELPL